MTHTLRSATIAIALLGSAGLALAGGDKSSSSNMQSGTTGQASKSTGSSMSKSSAQDTLNLTSAQKQTIAQELSREEPAAEERFKATIGAEVPSSIALKPVPMKIANEMPQLKNYSYAKLHNEDIVLADPQERTVAAIIDSGGASSTTGSAPSTSGSMQKDSGSMQKD
jgi:hypothetical protein